MNGGTIIAISLIIIGIIVFFISFLFLDKNSKNEKDENKRNVSNPFLDQQEEEIKNLANEKLSAMNEYYSYIMEEIEKKHKELLFLYHMITEKDNEINKKAENIGTKINEIFSEKEKALKNLKGSVNIQSTSQAGEFYNVKAEPGLVRRTVDNNVSIQEQDQLETDEYGHLKDFATNQIKGYTKNQTIQTKDQVENQVKLQTNELAENQAKSHTKGHSKGNLKEDKNDKYTSEIVNNNDIILDLYRQGCTINEIATKLGIGIGEVKLVIDLFSEVSL